MGKKALEILWLKKTLPDRASVIKIFLPGAHNIAIFLNDRNGNLMRLAPLNH
jgi:hypothetical protein